MIKRKLLKIGLILTLSFTVLTGCGSKENTTAKVDTSTTIEENTSDTKLVANNSTEKNTTAEKDTTTEKDSTTEKDTTTEVETQKVAEAEVTQPVTEAPAKVVETHPVTEAHTQAQKQAETKPVETEAPAEKETITAPNGMTYDKDMFDAQPDWWKEKVMHSMDDYNWAVEKVAEWKAINSDPAYLVGLFVSYSMSNWTYDSAGTEGKWKNAMSYYGSGVCDDIEMCFRTFCGVAGIPCERIEDWSVEGGHAWNKITIDEIQYEVDMTNTLSAYACDYLSMDEIINNCNRDYYGTSEHKADRFFWLDWVALN